MPTMTTPLLDAKPRILFDGDCGMSFTQGEDRTIDVTFVDRISGEPINLTGAGVFVNFPRSGGGTIKRTSAPLPISATFVTPGSPGSISYLGHRLVTGDPVTLTLTSGALPSPLAAATPYLVQEIDPDTFTLLGSDGSTITILTQGTGSFSLANASDLTITNAASGIATLVLRSEVTLAIDAGLGQAFQAGYILSGKIRIVPIIGVLDVYAQPDP